MASIDISNDELMTLRLLVDTEVMTQTDMFHRAKARELKMKLDAEFNTRLGFGALNASAAIFPLAAAGQMNIAREAFQASASPVPFSPRKSFAVP